MLNMPSGRMKKRHSRPDALTASLADLSADFETVYSLSRPFFLYEPCGPTVLNFSS